MASGIFVGVKDKDLARLGQILLTDGWDVDACKNGFKFSFPGKQGHYTMHRTPSNPWVVNRAISDIWRLTGRRYSIKHGFLYADIQNV